MKKFKLLAMLFLTCLCFTLSAFALSACGSDSTSGTTGGNSNTEQSNNSGSSSGAQSNATNHSTTLVSATSATCAENGNTAYYTCSHCDKWFEDSSATTEITDKTSVAISALGHNFGEWQVTTKATCTSSGKETRTCSRNSSHIETRDINKTEHTIVSDAAKEPTYTSTGLTEGSHCSECDTVIVAQREVAKLSYNTTAELLADNSETVKVNLEPLYDKVIKKHYGDKYEARKDRVMNYTWDIENAVDGKVQNLKLTFLIGISDGSRTFFVYKVIFENYIEIGDFLNAIKLENINATITEEYGFSYDKTTQGTDDNIQLANAVADALVNDGFDYSSNTEKLVNDEGQINDSDWSTARRFIIVLKNSMGIRYFYVRTTDKDNISDIVNDIQNGKIKLGEQKSVDFAGNQIYVDLTA
jgi:hypothetical protein